MKLALAAELPTGEQLLRSIAMLRAQGVRQLDAFTPYEVEGLQELLEVPRSRVPRIALVAGLGGGIAAYALEWWINVVNLPLDIGGRPLHSAPAFIPIAFEMAILFGATAAFVSALVLGGLPQLWHPMFEIEGFESATDDKFWLAISADDVALDRVAATAGLEALGARVVWLGDAR